LGLVRDILMRLGDRLSPRSPAIDETAWEVVELPLPTDAKKPYLDVIRGTPDGDMNASKCGTTFEPRVGRHLLA